MREKKRVSFSNCQRLKKYLFYSTNLFFNMLLFLVTSFNSVTNMTYKTLKQEQFQIKIIIERLVTDI